MPRVAIKPSRLLPKLPRPLTTYGAADHKTRKRRRRKGTELQGHEQVNGKTYSQAQLLAKHLQLVEQESSRRAKDWC